MLYIIIKLHMVHIMIMLLYTINCTIKFSNDSCHLCVCICPIEQGKAYNQTLQNAQQMNRNRNHADKSVISVNTYTINIPFQNLLNLNSLHDLIIREMLRKKDKATQHNRRQSNTQSCFSKKNSCLRWDLNPQLSTC